MAEINKELVFKSIKQRQQKLRQEWDESRDRFLEKQKQKKDETEYIDDEKAVVDEYYFDDDA